jgi:glutamine amidotransferase
MMLVIVNYGIGNVGSIKNMLKKIGAEARISSEHADIMAADRLVLSGVGSFDSAMEHFAGSGLQEALREKVLGQGTPLLGICLGMQLLTRRSEEGRLAGLGFVPGETVLLTPQNPGEPLRVPHMGWNTLSLKRESPLFDGLGDGTRFYFAHSYHVVLDDPSDALAATFHGREFVSVFRRNNITGVQFHPEKSHRFGIRLFRNFVEKG